MIAAAHFRRGGADGREQLAPAGSVTSAAASYTTSQAYWGKVTSRPPKRASKAAVDLAAFHLGVKPAALRQAMESGVFDG